MKRLLPILSALAGLLLCATSASAGSLTPSASPAATSFTLDDLYIRLTTNAAATEANHAFAPAAAPAGTLHTLTQVYNAIPTIDATKVKDGTAYLGVSGSLLPNGGTATAAAVFTGTTVQLTGDWTLDAGTLTLACATASFDGTANKVADAYDGAGNGSNRFCMTDSGDAAAGDILSGKIAWVDGLAVTGTIQTRTLSASTDAVLAGYYAAMTLSAVDTDLVAGNIKSGVTIFGIPGSLVVYAYGSNAAAKVLTTAEAAGTYSAVNLSPGTVKSGTSFGTGSTGAYPSSTYPLPSASATTDLAGNGTAITTSNGAVEWWQSDGTRQTATLDLPSASNVCSSATVNGSAGTLAIDGTKLLSGTSYCGTAGTITVHASDLASTARGASSGLNYLTVPQGYYDGTVRVSATDAQIAALASSLTAGNVKGGVTIFGVSGSGYVANTGDATAAAGDLLSGKTAYVQGSKITGTIQTRTLSASTGAVLAGYYASTTLSAVDTDLAAANIKSGTVIFGITGTLAGDNSGAYVLGTATAPGAALKNLWNGGSGSITGGSQTAGGTDDYNKGASAPAGRYVGPAGWTTCASGNSYCGTGDSGAQAKDNSTGLIFSKTMGSTYALDDTTASITWFKANNCTETSGSNCTKLTSSKTGCEANAGWALPTQKQWMQAYIDGGYDSALEVSGVLRAYWASPTYSANTTDAWRLTLASGNMGAVGKTLTFNVRCVRSA